MGLIDNVIAAVSPKRAYEREAWRQGLEAMRGYDAAGFGRINSGWRAHNESAEITDRYSRDVVRRARDLERNSDILQAVVLAYKRNVVGKGFTLRARTGDDDLNRQIEKLWRQWCKARNCDVTGEQSFTEILRMAVERKKVDGGILFLFRHTSGGVVPFKLQAIEVDELDVTQSAPHRQGNRVVGGIEYNSWRRPVGYWIQQYDLEGWRLLQPIYIDAKDAYFLKSKRRPSQIREMSDMSHTITRIRDVNEFINAVSVKERLPGGADQKDHSDRDKPGAFRGSRAGRPRGLRRQETGAGHDHGNGRRRRGPGGGSQGSGHRRHRVPESSAGTDRRGPGIEL